MHDCPGVGGRKYDVECGVVRWGPIGSDGVISHTASAHASQAFSIAHCTDSEHLPKTVS